MTRSCVEDRSDTSKIVEEGVDHISDRNDIVRNSARSNLCEVLYAGRQDWCPTLNVLSLHKADIPNVGDHSCMSSSSRSAIFSTDGLIRGFGTWAIRGFGLATVGQAVHDGDTVTIQTLGNLAVRFLGIDTPEISFQFPKIGDSNDGKWFSTDKFENYLDDPFRLEYPGSEDFKHALGDGLVEYLEKLLGPECAKNHYDMAQIAQQALETMIKGECAERAVEGKHYEFFMAFSRDVMDGYGRLLCYLHRNNTEKERKEKPFSYNERMLQNGMAFPYFIWPNVDPFRPMESYIKAVPPPDELKKWIDSPRLNQARDSVRQARENGKGVFKEGLILAPNELRFLARRRAPDRYVVNLKTCEPRLMEPVDYYLVENPEDRLYVDSHFVPLFREKGYTVAT